MYTEKAVSSKEQFAETGVFKPRHRHLDVDSTVVYVGAAFVVVVVVVAVVVVVGLHGHSFARGHIAIGGIRILRQSAGNRNIPFGAGTDFE